MKLYYNLDDKTRVNFEQEILSRVSNLIDEKIEKSNLAFKRNYENFPGNEFQ
jgi:hypothetical protein